MVLPHTLGGPQTVVGCWAPAAPTKAGGQGAGDWDVLSPGGVWALHPRVGRCHGGTAMPPLCCCCPRSIPLRCTAPASPHPGQGGTPASSPHCASGLRTGPSSQKPAYPWSSLLSRANPPPRRRWHFRMGMGTWSKMHNWPWRSVTWGWSPGCCDTLDISKWPTARPGQAGLDCTASTSSVPLLFGPIRMFLSGNVAGATVPRSPRASRGGRDPQAGGRVSLLYFISN